MLAYSSAGVCGVVRTTGLNALNTTSDYLCRSLMMLRENIILYTNALLLSCRQRLSHVDNVRTHPHHHLRLEHNKRKL
jgi:hypothetical protein